MLDISGIARHLMASEPYAWAEIERTIAPRDAAALAASFPIDAPLDGANRIKARTLFLKLSATLKTLK